MNLFSLIIRHFVNFRAVCLYTRTYDGSHWSVILILLLILLQPLVLMVGIAVLIIVLPCIILAARSQTCVWVVIGDDVKEGQCDGALTSTSRELSCSLPLLGNLAVVLQLQLPGWSFVHVDSVLDLQVDPA